MDMGFLRGNTSSPTEVKKHDLPPVGFTYFTKRAKHITIVGHHVKTCNTRNCPHLD